MQIVHAGKVKRKTTTSRSSSDPLFSLHCYTVCPFLIPNFIYRYVCSKINSFIHLPVKLLCLPTSAINKEHVVLSYLYPDVGAKKKSNAMYKNTVIPSVHKHYENPILMFSKTGIRLSAVMMKVEQS